MLVYYIMDTNTILIIFLSIIILFFLFRTNVTIIDTQPIKPVPVPVPAPIKPIGGCAGTRYGCCPNGVTARINQIGSNCV
jgi:hypothetical protein